jgi:hypothetical protein
MTNQVLYKFDVKESVGGSFLTPVYFDKNVLVKYLYDPRMSVQFASETYGTVYLPDSHLSFGINSKGAVIAWLGDLEELPLAEQHHWHDNNVAPHHDMKSEFYDAQINAVFTPSPVGIEAINAIDSWNLAFTQKHGTALYKPTSFEDRLDEVRRYKRIMIQSEDDFVVFVSELNEIVNENVDTNGLKTFLTANKVPMASGLKGNKLLELVYRDVLGDTTNLIEPFFLLYDLRLWADHNMGDDKLKNVAAKLGIADLTDFEGILTELLIRLRDAAKKLKNTYG